MIKNSQKHMVSLYINENMIQELKTLAEIREVSYASLVREAIKEYIKKNLRNKQ